MSDKHTQNKALIEPLRQAMYNFTEAGVRSALDDLLDADATVRMPHPWSEMTGPQALYETCYAPLFAAVPDLERRDYIVMAGRTEHGDNWLGCGGFYTGLFRSPWLGIPPSGHQMHMRFHEFYRFENNRVREIQTLWDIPEVMMQAGAWPMAPSLGREWNVPGPASLDGLVAGPYDRDQAQASCSHVVEMLNFMKKHPAQGGPELMQMERFWHPRMSWYGPAGIGTGRGIKGFRDWHQIPFLRAMPDRGQYLEDIVYHFFADRNYVAVTGWPNMIQTLTHDGWLGIAPAGKKITMCSLDFWRIENGLIRENWVMVDLLDAYRQLGVDVLARMKEFNQARYGMQEYSA